MARGESSERPRVPVQRLLALMPSLASYPGIFWLLLWAPRKAEKSPEAGQGSGAQRQREPGAVQAAEVATAGVSDQSREPAAPGSRRPAVEGAVPGAGQQWSVSHIKPGFRCQFREAEVLPGTVGSCQRRGRQAGALTAQARRQLEEPGHARPGGRGQGRLSPRATHDPCPEGSGKKLVHGQGQGPPGQPAGLSGQAAAPPASSPSPQQWEGRGLPREGSARMWLIWPLPLPLPGRKGWHGMGREGEPVPLGNETLAPGDSLSPGQSHADNDKSKTYCDPRSPHSAQRRSQLSNVNALRGRGGRCHCRQGTRGGWGVTAGKRKVRTQPSPTWLLCRDLSTIHCPRHALTWAWLPEGVNPSPPGPRPPMVGPPTPPLSTSASLCPPGEAGGARGGGAGGRTLAVLRGAWVPPAAQAPQAPPPGPGAVQPPLPQAGSTPWATCRVSTLLLRMTLMSFCTMASSAGERLRERGRGP